CFAANQRCSGLSTAFGNTLDDRGGHVTVETGRRIVIEKEQRLGTCNKHIVDAHGHQVDAYACIAFVINGQAKLGADTVGARDEHGATIARHGYLEQATETTEATNDFRTSRGLHRAAYCIYKPV